TLGLLLTRWTGTYKGVEATWLRFAQLDGTLLPTPDEKAEAAERRAAALEARLAHYRERFGELGDTEGEG
ncbi:MAG: Uma2 family endonuclease, partial [Anaerolineae bacterium]|nr:Uma2 family endonuclease [Anaerolineae bacterium]